MATFRIDSNIADPNNHTTSYEVFMLADSTGNVVSLSSTSASENSSTNTVIGINENNSSTTPLANNATFTGEWEDVGVYDSVTVAIATDQNGYYSVQFSPDGVNQDSTLTRYHRTNRINAPHKFTITRRYCRVVFTNDNDSGSAQSYFRLQTMFSNDRSALNAPLDAVLAQDYDAEAVRPTDYKYEVALGLRQGQQTWNKWGYNSTVPNSTVESTVWTEGGRLVPLTGANTINIRSSSASDNVSQTGAQSIIIYGNDANNKATLEVVQLNGTSNVSTVNEYVGINRMAIYLAGSSGLNTGNITATAVTAGTRQGIIPAGEGSTQQAFFFVQRDHTALVDWLWINVSKQAGKNPIVTLKMWVKSLVSGARYEVFRAIIDTTVENVVELKPSQPFVVGEESLLELTATSDKDDTVVSARFSLIETRLVEST